MLQFMGLQRVGHDRMTELNCKCLVGFPWWFSGKGSTCQCKGHGFSSWFRKIPWRRKWQPTPVFHFSPHGTRVPYYTNTVRSTLLLLFSHSVMSDSLEIPWTVAHKASLSMGFPRQKYYSGLSFPPPGYLPKPRIKTTCEAPLSTLST